MESIEPRHSSHLESLEYFMQNNMTGTLQDNESDYSSTYRSSSAALSSAQNTVPLTGSSYNINQYVDYLHTPSTSHSTMIAKSEDSIYTGINQYTNVEAAGLLSWNLLNEIKLEEQFDNWKIMELHRRIVPTRKGATSSSAAYFWTKRTTSTDIMSTAITTSPIGAGRLMEDLSPDSLPKTTVIQKQLLARKGPLDGAVSQKGMTTEERERVNQGLWLEHSIFMEKLARKREQRHNIENYAAIIIQSVFRRYLIIKRWDIIKGCLRVRQEMQAEVRSYLRFNNLLLTRKQLKEFKTQRREANAVYIQCFVRRWLAYRAYERRMLHFTAERRNISATKIQCMIRVWRANQWTRALREMVNLAKRDAAVLLIQKTYRGTLGRRKYNIYNHLLKQTAAIMIQCMYRQRMSMYRVKAIRLYKKNKAEYKGVLGVQKVTRGYLGRKRFNRIKKEKWQAKRVRAASIIQTKYRSVLGFRKTINRSIRRSQFRTLGAIITVQRIVRGFLGRKRMEKVRLWLSINIWYQIKIGNLEGVEDVYEGYDTDEPLDPSHTDENGNTLLHIAAKYNHLSIVRKCMGWGVKSNAKNKDNETPLQMALASSALQVSQYLLSKESSTIMSDAGEAGEGLLQAAAKGAMHQCLLNMINMGFEPTKNISLQTGKTALHSACEAGNVDMCHFLLNLDSEANDWVGLADKKNRTALHYASIASGKEKGMKDIIDMISKKTDQKMKILPDQNGMTAKILALLYGNFEVAKMLVEEPAKDMYDMKIYEKPIEWLQFDPDELIKVHRLYLKSTITARNGKDEKSEKEYTAALIYLLSLGLPIYLSTEKSSSNLFMDSAKLGLVSVVETCMSHYQFKGASNIKNEIFKCNETGATWLHYLLTSTSSDSTIHSSIPILANIENELKIADNNGRYPLHIAALHGHKAAPFIPKDEDFLSKIDNFGCNAFYLAAQSLQTNFVQEIIDIEPKYCTMVNTVTGLTPLQACCTASLSNSCSESSTKSLVSMLRHITNDYKNITPMPGISSENFNMNINPTDTSVISHFITRGEECMTTLLSTMDSLGVKFFQSLKNLSDNKLLDLLGFSGNLGAVKVILEKIKTFTDEFDDLNRSLFYTCIEYGHLHAVKFMLDEYPNLINPIDQNMSSNDKDAKGKKGKEKDQGLGLLYDTSVTTVPIHSAIKTNRLLYSPLAIAIIHRKADKQMLDYFISKGLVCTYKCEGGVEDRNIFHVIAEYGTMEDFQIMLDTIYSNQGSTEKPTSFSTTAYLTQHNSKMPLIEQRDSYGITPMIQAILVRNDKIADFLMKKLAFKSSSSNVHNTNLKENRQLNNYRLIQNFGTIGWFNAWIQSEENFLNTAAAVRRGSAYKRNSAI